MTFTKTASFCVSFAIAALAPAIALAQRAPARPQPRPVVAPTPAPPQPSAPGDEGDDNDAPQPPRPRPSSPPSSSAGPASDAMETVTTQGAAPSSTTQDAELFPLASRLIVRALDLGWDDVVAVDAAMRKTPGSWLCADASQAGCQVTSHVEAGQGYNKDLLIALQVNVPAYATPITVWTVGEGLAYNPKLIAQGSGNRARWSPPIGPLAKVAPEKGKPPPPMMPPPMGAPMARFEGELEAAFRWPVPSEVMSYEFVAIADECGAAVVTKFAREFTVPVAIEQSGSCTGSTTEGPLRLYKNGGTLRVTAFNLKKPARGSVMSTTYRVVTPSVESDGRGMHVQTLLPDFGRDDLRIACGPPEAKPAAIAHAPPKPGQPPPMPTPAPLPGHVLATSTFVIGPEPLRTGYCRIVYTAPNYERFRSAPVVLHVVVDRTDVVGTPQQRTLDDERWVLGASGTELVIPALPAVDSESRLRVTVSSDPLDGASAGILLTDARRGLPRPGHEGNDPSAFRRDLASASVITAPLCGGWTLKNATDASSCLRVYVTLPAMLAIAQITRAPWQEKALTDLTLPGGIGVALGFDSYDPARQRPFPVALQIGGAYERLTSSKSGILTYVGVAPTLPVLGTGGTTTTIGLLAGVGTTYIVDASGPNEGLKPAAFAAFVVGAGQVVVNSVVGGAGFAPPPR